MTFLQQPKLLTKHSELSSRKLTKMARSHFSILVLNWEERRGPEQGRVAAGSVLPAGHS